MNRKKRRKKKKLGWLILFVILTAAVIFSVSSGFFKNPESGSGESWSTVSVTRRDISSSVRATGIIKPKIGAEVRVGSRISGLVKRLYVRIGDTVRKGEILAELDSTELEARRNQAFASLEKARSSLKYAELDLRRLKELLKEGFVSHDDVDIADREFEVAKMQIKESEANLKYSEVQLNHSRIHSPIGGVVASVSTQEGETVAATFSTPTFVTIIDLNRLEVWAYVDETDIGRVSVGQNALFTVDTYSETDFKGEVTAIYPKAEIQSNVVNYVTVLKILDFQDRILRPEMTTTVSIYLDTKKDVLTVPREAVKREQGQKYIIGLEADKLVKKWVKTGWRDNDFQEILEGLKENDQVILSDMDIEQLKLQYKKENHD